jgi:hypothetical protein
MATFPAGIGIVLGSVSEEPPPAVVSSPMERGVPKVRRDRSDVLVPIKAQLQFRNAAQFEEFRAWFYSPTGAGAGAAFFSMQHPRTGATVQARIAGGQLGALSPIHGTWRQGYDRCRCAVTFEVLQTAY